MAKEKVFKISDDQIKEMYLNGASLGDIAKVAQDNKGLMALRNRLHKLGVDTTKNMKRYSLKLSKSSKKYTLNEHIFDVIDTQEKAYWLGFLMADGYNHVSHCCVALRLQEEDKEILEKFRDFLEADNVIYTFTRKTITGKIRNYCELNICSPYFSESLAKLGCTQAKTYTLKLPDLEEPLMQHFLRGYFDGDGCFSVTKRTDRKKETSMRYQLNIVGMTEPMIIISEVFNKNANVCKSPLRSSSNNKAVRISWNGKGNCTKILNYLYRDASIYLKRKHDKYLEYCNSAE